MREIKFRAKQEGNPQWLLGCVYKFSEGTLMLSEDEYGRGIVHKVIPETVGEFTGLRDKNGVEIYEGDVVSTGIKENAEVVFGEFKIGENDWSIEYAPPYFCIKWKDGSGYSVIDKDCIVTGNIYENPELLTP